MLDKIIEKLSLDTYWINRDYPPRHNTVEEEEQINLEEIPKVDQEVNKTLTQQDIKELASEYSIELPSLQAFIEVESGGRGFDKNTGKIIIQFEPHYFRRNEPQAPNTGIWNTNKIDIQSREWVAFNDAFKISPDSAMKSTSIGLMQVMGQNYKDLGFKTVGEMWDFGKKSERNQVELGLLFIKNNKTLYKALQEKNWHLVAYYYNGSKYKEQAKRLGIVPYDIQLQKAYKKYLKL